MLQKPVQNDGVSIQIYISHNIAI